MANTKNIISILALATCTAVHVASSRENDVRTFAGAKLDLVLAADNGETTVNNLDSLTADERDEVAGNFRVVRLHGRTRLGEGFYVINENGTIEKFIIGQRQSDQILPSSDGDCYLLCTGSSPTGFHYPHFPLIKELYSIDGGLRWRHEIIGYVDASEDLSTIGVFFPESYSEKYPNIRIIDKTGNLINNHKPYCGYPWFVSRDGKKIIVPEYGGILPANAMKGTRVFNKNGKLLFTLNPDYLCHFGPGDGPKLYGSDQHIIQVCYEVGREKVEPEPADPEKRYREAKTEKPGYYVQTYTADGYFKWQKKFEEAVSIGVSENDKHLFIYVPETTPRYEVISTETGTLEYVIVIPDVLGFTFAEAALSNDGRKCCVILRKFGTKEPFPAKSEALLFEDGNEIAKFEKTYDIHEMSSGRYHAEFSADGNLIVMSCDTSFRIFTIKTRR